MKDRLRLLLSGILLATQGLYAQQVLFQREVEGQVAYVKSLSDKNYVSSNFVFFDGDVKMPLVIIDKKLKTHELKYTSSSYLNAYTGISSEGPHFYVPFNETKQLGKQILSEELRIGKYTNSGEEIWLKKFSRAYPGIYNSCNLLLDNNRVNVIYIDSAQSLVLQTFDEDGNDLSFNPIISLKTARLPNIYGLFKTGINRFVTFYQKEGLSDRIHTLNILIFNDSGLVLVDRRVPIDSFSVSSPLYGGVSYENNLYGMIAPQDSSTLLSRVYLTKIDTGGHLEKVVYLDGYQEPGIASLHNIILSNDNHLYVSYNTNLTESHLYKFDLAFNLKWEYTFDKRISSMDTAVCNGILVAFPHYDPGSGTSSTTIKIIRDPDLPVVCDRCNITAYPNPTTDGNITLQTDDSDVTIQQTNWYDSNGKLVWQSLGDQQQLHAQPDLLASGMYYTITTCDNDKSAQRRVIISK